MAGGPGADDRELLEREPAQAALAGWLEEVRRTRAGRLVLLAGEAGVGKTSLLARFCAGARSVPALWGWCEPLATPAPLEPLADVAAGLRGATAAVLIGGARPYEVARALLEELERERMAIVVLEDLHWADEGSLDALAYLARRIERAPALVIGTYRDDELDASHPLRITLGLLSSGPRVERLRLDRLSRDAVSLLARAAARDPEAVYTATGGNPFFVAELLAGPAGEVPRSVRDAVLLRASPLEEQARALLEAIAVVPAETELWLLERVSPAGLEGLGQCLAAGIVEPHGQAVRFRHELARRALEQELGVARARELHGLVLRALEEAGAAPARLVHHAERAGEERALFRRAVAAAEHSAALGAHREAAAHYQRAIAASAAASADGQSDLLQRCAFELYSWPRECATPRSPSDWSFPGGPSSTTCQRSWPSSRSARGARREQLPCASGWSPTAKDGCCHPCAVVC